MGKEGLLPIIRIGSWVRLNSHTSLPEEARGQNAVVLGAPVKHVIDNVEGDYSPQNYEMQEKGTKFLVRVRESGQTLEVTRDKFAAVATNVGGLAAPSVGTNGHVAPEDRGPNVPEGEKVYLGDGAWVDPHTGETFDEVEGEFVPAGMEEED